VPPSLTRAFESLSLLYTPVNLYFNIWNKLHTGFDRVGHDGLARMVATIRDALDEYHCEIHSMVVEDNKAFCRLRFTGKHVGPLLGKAPTHQTVAWMGATEFTCQNGKILKVWELGDVKSLEEQLNRAAASLDHTANQAHNNPPS
jgi:predicted ester cyclase